MKKLLIALVISFSFFLSTQITTAQQGCCSWHGGISHCGSNGRYVCNDGTYSPTCTCSTGGGRTLYDNNTEWCGVGSFHKTQAAAKAELDGYWKKAQDAKVCPTCQRCIDSQKLQQAKSQGEFSGFLWGGGIALLSGIFLGRKSLK